MKLAVSINGKIYGYTIAGNGDIISVKKIRPADIDNGFLISDTFNPDKILDRSFAIPAWYYDVDIEQFSEKRPILISEVSCNDLKYSCHIVLYSVEFRNTKPDLRRLKNPDHVRKLVEADPNFKLPNISFLAEWNILVDFKSEKPHIFVSRDGDKPEKQSPATCGVLDNYSFFRFKELEDILPLSPGVSNTDQLKLLINNPSMRGVKAFDNLSGYNRCKNLLHPGSTPEKVLGVDKRILPFINHDIETREQLTSYRCFCQLHRDDMDEVIDLYANAEHIYPFEFFGDFVSWALTSPTDNAATLRKKFLKYTK